MPYEYKWNETCPPITVHWLGEPGCSDYYHEIQDYEEIRDKCLNEGKLFEDPYFKCEIKGHKEFQRKVLEEHQKLAADIKWLRPKEISADACFISDGFNRFDVNQNWIGDCWFIAAMACIAEKPELFERIVPLGQSFTEKYAGVFHFRFWYYGKWVDVVIDDRLPTINGELYSVASNDRKEFWSALLEKAYAKLYTSYDALPGGLLNEAMEDFTGGMSIEYKLMKPQLPSEVDLFGVIRNANQEAAIMCCAVDTKRMEEIPGNHAYSITNVSPIKIEDQEIRLIRIRNPWGDNYEWKGCGSDNHPIWKLVPDSVKKDLKVSFKRDGEFWMEFEAFVNVFWDLCITYPDSFNKEFKAHAGHKAWHCETFEGSWCPDPSGDAEWLSKNPQFPFKVEDGDKHDGKGNAIIINLMQKNIREGTTTKEERASRRLKLKWNVYKITDGMSLPLPASFFLQNEPVKKSYSSDSSQRMNERTYLPAGLYCIIPKPQNLEATGDFFLRVFTERKMDSRNTGYDIHQKELTSSY